MIKFKYTDKDFKNKINFFNRKFSLPDKVKHSVRDIISDVRLKGDNALIDLSNKFDNTDFKNPNDLLVKKEEFTEARSKVDIDTKEAIKLAFRNVKLFANKSIRKNWEIKNEQGARVGERFLPFDRVGVYVPGGTAPLVSTINMTVSLASIAGCKDIVVMTPSDSKGNVNPNLLYTLEQSGATEVYKIGGAHAIAAMALGTSTIHSVSKIYGPGNSYVVEAKRQLFGETAIDLLPGPSEIMILADKSANAKFVAYDVLAQAEHGKDSLMVFITDSEDLLKQVENQVTDQKQYLSRINIIDQSLNQGFFGVLVESINEGVEIANKFAPEHLSLIVENEDLFIDKITNSGAIFVGNSSPVAVGDFIAGPSHVLPTGGAGKSFSGLTIDMFQRRTSIIKLDDSSLKKSNPLTAIFSKLEGLDAHGRSVSIRLDKK